MLIFFKKNCKIVFVFIFLLSSTVQYCLFRALSVSPVLNNDIIEYVVGFSCVNILYPNDSRLLELANFIENSIKEYLKNESNYFENKDLMVETFSKANKFKEFILEPSIVQHIGMHSSLYQRDLSSESYWKMYKSFSYPDFDKIIKFDLEYLLPK